VDVLQLLLKTYSFAVMVCFGLLWVFCVDRSTECEPLNPADKKGTNKLKFYCLENFSFRLSIIYICSVRNGFNYELIHELIELNLW